MRTILIALLGAVALGAAEPCPWINAATVSGFLNLPAKAVVTRNGKNKDDASCVFSPVSQNERLSLRVEAQTMAKPSFDYPAYRRRCASDETPVRAIGNEAVACRMVSASHEVTEQIIGRVRDRAFVVALVTASESNPVRDPHAVVHDIAEMVAGNLF